MTNYVQLSTGLYKASSSVQFYELDLAQPSRVLLQVFNDTGTSAIYDSNMQYLARTGIVLLDPGTYIVRASYSSTTNAVMAVYIPSQSSFDSLPTLSSGTFKAATYSNFYALNIKEGGNVFIAPSGDSATAVIYDTNMNFVAYGGDNPIYLDQGNYIVDATYNGYKNGALNVSIPDGMRGNDGSMYPSPLLKNNVFHGSSAPDLVQGLDGNDRFTGYFDYSKPDAFFGGAGIDTAVYRGATNEYSVQIKTFQDLRKPDGVFITGVVVSDHVPSRDGTDYLNDVERLQFADQSVAFDLSGNAGIAAKLLGVVFGAAAVGNKGLVGVALSLLDSGMSYETVMQLALSVRLGGGASHKDVVDLLFFNLVRVQPNAETEAILVDLLDSGAFTPASLGMLAADLSLNEANVNLVGLANTGLLYLPA